MAAALSRRTERAKSKGYPDNAFCLREHPLNIAEEHAMIDCITGGRLITGMVRGIGAEVSRLAPTLPSRMRDFRRHARQLSCRPGRSPDRSPLKGRRPITMNT